MDTSTHPYLLPIATALSSALFGGMLGAMLFSSSEEATIITRDQEQVVEVPRAYTDEELEIACLPLMRKTASNLEDAQNLVVSLEDQVREKATEIETMQATMTSRAERGRAMAAELKFARAQLQQLEEELEVALEDKERILVKLEQTQQELKETRVELSDQKEQTRAAKEESIDNSWSAFTADAQLQICEKGNRKKMTNCRETVGATLTEPLRQRYESCARSGQAIPVLRQRASAASELPETAHVLDESDRVLKLWFIQFCDPALPERLTPQERAQQQQEELTRAEIEAEAFDATEDEAFDFLPEKED